MTKRTSVFTAVLIAVMSLAVGMVLASRLDLTPSSGAQPMEVPRANSEPINGSIDATTFRRIAQAVSPAVVSIQTRTRARRTPTSEFLEQNPFFGNPRGQQQPPRRGGGTGSGFIIDKANGYILTNNHVVEDAEEINVAFYGDARGADMLSAKVIGRDPLTDSALVQLTERPRRDLMQVNFGDSSQMAPGDWVVAIGNPFQLRHTVTVGVVSAVGRDEFQQVSGRSQEMIQTDAAINPGNSGGPLLNIRGEVVGINSAIFTNEAASGNIGIGFAIPINAVRDLLPQLRTGRVIRGQLGVEVNPAPFTEEAARDLGIPGGGAEIRRVTPGSAAAKAGIEPGDVIIEFNGRSVRSSNELISMVVATKPGTTVPVKIVRNRQQRTLNVTVAELDLLREEDSGRQARQGTESGIGIEIEQLSPQLQRRLEVPSGRGGAVVTNVVPDSPADRAGFAEGDVILSVNGRAVSSADDVIRAIDASGTVAQVLVWRQGETIALRVRKR